jgi:hypothetical protein
MKHAAAETARYGICLGVLLLASGSLVSCSDTQTDQAGEPVAASEPAPSPPAVAPSAEGDDPDQAEAPREPAAEVADTVSIKIRDEVGIRYETTSVDSAAPLDPSPETGTAEDTVAGDVGGTASRETAAAQPEMLESYKVNLAVDARLKLPGSPGEIIVWIGDPQYQAALHPGMETDETTVPAVGETAEVEVYAPDFDYQPAAPQCIRIHPRGSEVRFKIWPRESGTFEVGADVRLYGTDDCTGPPVPRALANLEVEVLVDSGKLVERGAGELLQVAWEKFLEFWGYLLAVVFGLLLFLFKGRLARLFGYKPGD